MAINALDADIQLTFPVWHFTIWAEKNFSWMFVLSNRKIDPIIEEVAKCILLCHNCHAEVHNPGLDLAKLLIEPTALTPELHPLVRTDGQLTQNK